MGGTPLPPFTDKIHKVVFEVPKGLGPKLGVLYIGGWGCQTTQKQVNFLGFDPQQSSVVVNSHQ